MVKAELISYTAFPLETLFIIWEQSRSLQPIYSSPEGLQAALSPSGSKYPIKDMAIAKMLNQNSPETLRSYFWKTVSTLLTEAIPCTESISLTYLLSGIPISLREQIVRHRIGSRIGDSIGADIVPDLAQSSFWAQSMRMLDMGSFYDDGGYFSPESILQSSEALISYEDILSSIQDAYNSLISMGIPEEDARQVLPLATTHSLTWSLNLKSLAHIIGKRSCWVSQLGMWRPLIEGMVSELIHKIHPIFRVLINPPCIHGDEFRSCPYQLMNQERIQGKDPFPPCSLFLHHHKDEAISAANSIDDPKWKVSAASTGDLYASPEEYDRYYSMKTQFAELWHRDPDTGKAISI